MMAEFHLAASVSSSCWLSETLVHFVRMEPLLMLLVTPVYIQLRQVKVPGHDEQPHASFSSAISRLKEANVFGKFEITVKP